MSHLFIGFDLLRSSFMFRRPHPLCASWALAAPDDDAPWPAHLSPIYVASASLSHICVTQLDVYTIFHLNSTRLLYCLIV